MDEKTAGCADNEEKIERSNIEETESMTMIDILFMTIVSVYCQELLLF